MSLREELFKGSLLYRSRLLGKSGSFCWMNLSEILLGNELLSPIPCRVNTSYTKKGTKNSFLSETLKIGTEALWANGCSNSLIICEDSNGYLLPLSDLWGEYLKDGYQEDKTIPLYIELKGYYSVDEETSKNYILNFICKQYLHKENITDEDRSAVVEIMKESIKIKGDTETKPSVILLIDGMNSINGSNKNLFDQLIQIEGASGIQVIVASNADIRPIYNWIGFGSLSLVLLSGEEIHKYMEMNGVKITDNRKLIEVLKNPVLLEMYTSTNKAINEYGKYFKDIEGCKVKEFIQTAGEIIWNFVISCMLIKIYNEGTPLSSEEEKEIVVSVKFLLPKIGYKMEQNSSLYIDSKELKTIINEVYASFNKNALEVSSDLQDGILEKIIDVLCDKLMLLRKKEGVYSFPHWKLREYFSSIYIQNEIELGIKKKEVTVVLKEKPISINVRTFLGEIMGEQYNIPRLLDKKWSMDHYKRTALNTVLDLCRGNFETTTDFSVWNIIETWKAVKGELSGEDLSNLNLLGIQLNNIRCSRYDTEKYTAAQFDGSLISEEDILFQSHIAAVSSVSYSKDGKKILSASYDGTVKEWSTETGECLNTYTRYPGYLPIDTNSFIKVNCAVYSKAEDKILTASNDGTICEWKVNNTERPLTTYYCPNSKIKSAIYSPDEGKILSTNGNIYEWVVGENEKPINIYTPETNLGVCNAVYSSDGQKILSTSNDGNINEWVDGKTISKIHQSNSNYLLKAIYSPDGKKILTPASNKTFSEFEFKIDNSISATIYKGHCDIVKSTIYNETGKKIVSTSNDKTIKEWDAVTGECLRTFHGHNNSVNKAVYSVDEKKILSASDDYTIKEWDIETGACLKTYGWYFSEHSGSQIPYSVNSAIYSSDDKKILSAFCDGTAREWDVVSKKCLQIITGHDSPVNAAVYSGDGKKILTASSDHTVKEWDAETGECIHTFTGHDDAVNCVLYCTDNNTVLSGSSDRAIKEWDVKTGKCIGTYLNHGNEIFSALYNSKADKILSASMDFTAKEWDVIDKWGIDEWHPVDEQDLCESKTLNCPGECSLKKKICNDSTLLNTIKFSTDPTGKNTQDISICSAVYSTDEKKILTSASDDAISKGGVTEWSVDQKGILFQYPSEPDKRSAVKSAIYNTDSTKILAASNKKDEEKYFVEEWTVGNAENAAKTYIGHRYIVNSAVYSNDGKKVLSASFDGTLREWDAENAESISVTNNILCLLVQGCSFVKLNSGSILTSKNRELLQQYGAIFE